MEAREIARRVRLLGQSLPPPPTPRWEVCASTQRKAAAVLDKDNKDVKDQDTVVLMDYIALALVRPTSLCPPPPRMALTSPPAHAFALVHTHTRSRPLSWSIRRPRSRWWVCFAPSCMR
jgi:hypothetical protein